MASGPFLTSNRFESVKNSIGTPNPSIHHGSVLKNITQKIFPKKKKKKKKITKMGIFIYLFFHTPVIIVENILTLLFKCTTKQPFC